MAAGEYQFNGFLPLCQNEDIVHNTSGTGQNWSLWFLEEGIPLFLQQFAWSACVKLPKPSQQPQIAEFKQSFCKELQSLVLESVGRNTEQCCVIPAEFLQLWSHLGHSICVRRNPYHSKNTVTFPLIIPSQSAAEKLFEPEICSSFSL